MAKRQREAAGAKPATSSAEILVRVGQALGLTNVALADRLGVSRRTVQRWMARQTSIGPQALLELAELVAPAHRALAVQAVEQARAMYASIGWAAPPTPFLDPPPPPPAAPAPPRAMVAHALLGAAAEAADVSPRAIRPALLATLRCARELGLTLEAAEAALEATRDGGQLGAKTIG